MIVKIKPETYIRNRQFIRLLLSVSPDEQELHLRKKARELRRREKLRCLDTIHVQDLGAISVAIRQAQPDFLTC